MVKEICEASQINHQAMYSSLKAIIKMYDSYPDRLQILVNQMEKQS